MLIVSERKTIGREMAQTSYVIKQLAEAGVEIFEYMHGKSLTPRNAMDKVVGALQGFTDEEAREESSERIHEAHMRKHKAGHVSSGVRVFGYRNEHVYNGVDAHGNPLKSHTERVIDPTEAAVVRRIFERYDAGDGLKRIANLLTREGAARPKQSRAHRWSVACRRLVPVHGARRARSRDLSRRRHLEQDAEAQQRREVGADVTAPAVRMDCHHVPELRIIDDPSGSVCKRAAPRLKARPCGLPVAGSRAAHRSTPRRICSRGWPRAALCGGGLVVETAQATGSVRRIHVPSAPRQQQLHQRAAHLGRGDERGRAASRRRARLDAGGDRAGDPTLRARRLTEQQTALTREQKDLETRIARLVAAIETGGDAASLATKLRQLETRQRAIVTRLATCGRCLG